VLASSLPLPPSLSLSHTFPLKLAQVSLAEFIGAFKHGEGGGLEGGGAGGKKRNLANADPIDLDNQERLMHAQQVHETLNPKP